VIHMSMCQNNVGQLRRLSRRHHKIEKLVHILFRCTFFPFKNIKKNVRLMRKWCNIPVSINIFEDPVPIKYVFVPCNVLGPGFNPRIRTTLSDTFSEQFMN
jgi:hypothetical protein